jgi:hypothetical protein
MAQISLRQSVPIFVGSSRTRVHTESRAAQRGFTVSRMSLEFWSRGALGFIHYWIPMARKIAGSWGPAPVASPYCPRRESFDQLLLLCDQMIVNNESSF